VIQLPSGDSLAATISQVSALALGLMPGISAYAVFKSNAVDTGRDISCRSSAADEVKNVSSR